jgi:hypothetical protein
MTAKAKPTVGIKSFLTESNAGRTVAEYRVNDRIYDQGDAATHVFLIKEGRVKLTVLSGQESAFL